MQPQTLIIMHAFFDSIPIKLFGRKSMKLLYACIVNVWGNTEVGPSLLPITKIALGPSCDVKIPTTLKLYGFS